MHCLHLLSGALFTSISHGLSSHHSQKPLTPIGPRRGKGPVINNGEVGGSFSNAAEGGRSTSFGIVLTWEPEGLAILKGGWGGGG